MYEWQHAAVQLISVMEPFRTDWTHDACIYTACLMITVRKVAGLTGENEFPFEYHACMYGKCVLTVTVCLCRCAAPMQDPPVLPYLQETDRHIYDINLEVSLQPQASREPTVIAQSNLKHL